MPPFELWDDLAAATVATISTVVIGWATLRGQLAKIRAQLEPNHGSSAVDAINRIEAIQTVQTQVLDRLEDAVQGNGKDIREVRRDVRQLAADVSTDREIMHQNDQVIHQRIDRMKQKRTNL